MMSEDLVDTLISQNNLSAALREIFHQQKAKRKGLSLTKLCDMTGIKSKGYLSEVLSGKKLIKSSYLEGLCEALEIEGIGLDIMKILHAMEEDSESEKQQRLLKRLSALRRSLITLSQSDSSQETLKLFEFEVYCAFGLFSGEPKKSDLRRYFGKDRYFALDQALFQLEKRQWITSHPSGGSDSDPCWRLVEGQVLFSDSHRNFSHEAFLKQAILDAAKQLERWHKNKHEAHFESYIISVNDEAYRKALGDFRNQLLVLCNELETTTGDRLVKIHWQAYPMK